MRIFNHKNVARLTTHKSHRTLHTHTQRTIDSKMGKIQMIENVVEKRLVAFHLMCVLVYKCCFFSLFSLLFSSGQVYLVLFIVTLEQLHHIHAKYLNCRAYFLLFPYATHCSPFERNNENLYIFMYI